MDALIALLILVLVRLVIPLGLLLLAGTWVERRRYAG